jgi:hypothetical protein
MQYELFNIRNQQDFDKYYPIIKLWWEERNWTSIQPEFLSTRGIIIKDKERYVCAAWLYTTDSAYGVINWVITNNISKPKQKRECLKFMFKVLEKYAKHLNILAIYMVMETRSLKNLLKKEGFSTASNNITEFIKYIKYE